LRDRAEDLLEPFGALDAGARCIVYGLQVDPTVSGIEVVLRDVVSCRVEHRKPSAALEARDLLGGDGRGDDDERRNQPARNC